MNKIEYNLGILKRFIAGYINGKPYVMLDDAEYIVKNGDAMDASENKFMKAIEGTIKDILDRRPGSWPEYYDECDAKEYHEWFIKGTNIKLGFDYIDGETDEHCWYKIVCNGYDPMEHYETEEKFLEDIEWMLKNKDLTWRYYE